MLSHFSRVRLLAIAWPVVCGFLQPRMLEWGNFPLQWEVQWLRFLAFTTGVTSLIPGWGIKLPHATLCGQKKKKKILKRVAMPSSRGSSRPRDRTHICMSPALAGGFFTTSVTWEAYKIQWLLNKENHMRFRLKYMSYHYIFSPIDLYIKIQ